ncbi:MAG: hypothetical protein ABS78_19455 [Phenylobacterium sp. SCN 70-31]|nr:MAG: hypothetical protein ABS78_19455 [Phenylobacterium sp. SCN 70-31]
MGEYAMKAAGVAYLPKEPAEEDDEYKNRLARSTFINYFERTLQTAAGKVLSRPINLVGADDILKVWSEDIDLEGNHLDQFLKTVFIDGLAYGVTYILVDSLASATPNRTVADDRAQGIRPYFVHVPNKRLINWRFERVNGRYKLTLAVIDESGMVPDGEFDEKFVNRVRVLRPGSYQVIQREPDPNPVKAKEGKTVDVVVEEGPYGDTIPLVPFYTNRTGRFEAHPPLHNLATLNLRHYQSKSDQNNILKVARVPSIVWKRSSPVGDTEPQRTIALGGNQSFEIGPDEELGFLEHTGAAIEAGQDDLNDLEEQMTKVGFQLVARDTSGDVTATENTLNSAEAHAALTAYAENFKDTVELALKHMVEMGGEPNIEPEVTITKDFASTSTATDVPLLLQLFSTGVIDAPTLVAEAKRRGLLGEDVIVSNAVVVPVANTAIQ